MVVTPHTKAPVSKTGGWGFDYPGPLLPLVNKEIMKNPLKFFQEVKNEAFKVSWPTSKETVQGSLMVAAMAIIASLFFLLLDQILKFFLKSFLR